jgi:hypothetical protein
MSFKDRVRKPQVAAGPRSQPRPKRRDPDLNDPNIDEPGRRPEREAPGKGAGIDRPGQPPGRPDQEIDLPGPDRVPDPTRQD